MRRVLVILPLLAILGGITWWLWGWDSARQQRTDPWRMVPANAAAIIEVSAPISSWERFKSTSQAWNSWSGYPGCQALDSLMVSVRMLFEAQAGGAAMADASDLLIVITAAEDGFNATLCWSFNDHRALERFELLVPGIRAGRAQLREIAALPAMEGAIAEGALLLSTSSQELTDAVARIAKTSQSADSLLTAARGTLGEGSDAHLLVHLGRAQRLLTTWLRPEAMRALDDLDGWAALDLRARPEATLLSGLLFDPTPPPLLHATHDQGAGIANMGRVLPARITSLWQVNITDPARFHAEVTSEDADAALFDAYGAWAYGALGIATAGSATDSSERAWAVVPTEDPTRARDALTARCPTGCDTLVYRNVRMTRSADTSALAAVWGEAFTRFERPWWSVLNDRVVFCEQVGTLREAIDAWADGSSFQQDVRHGSLFRRYASESMYTWWCDGASSVDALRPGMKERGERTYQEHRDGWRSVGACLVQLVPDEAGRYQLTACMSGSGTAVSTGGASSALWSVTVGAPITAGPYLLTDHLSRTKQLLVQDKKHRIHLVSCTGKVLWQREVDGPILGDVHQVDRYKNGKLQMLFNTAERVYLIDRNGENVEHFPIALPEQASAPLNVFDYDGKRDYRVLVPTVGAQLLNFDMNGKAVDGWKTPKTASTCEVPVEHLRIRGQDHLVIVDRQGNITVVDRRGEPRYAPKLIAKDATRFIGLLAGMEIGETRIFWEDQEHTVVRGSLSGTIDTLGIGADSAIASGVLRYPGTGLIPEGASKGLDADIDLDGSTERVTVTGEGRISVEHAQP